MKPSLRLAALLIVATAIGLALPDAAVAQDRDVQEVSRYVLTEAGLGKFKQASQNLAAAPGACADEDDDGSESKSLDQMVAKLNAKPGAQAAIQSAGMTTREYVVFMFSMFQTGMASWAVSQPGGKLPPGVSQANVDFIKQHEAAIAAMDQGDPCENSADEEEPEE